MDDKTQVEVRIKYEDELGRPWENVPVLMSLSFGEMQKLSWSSRIWEVRWNEKGSTQGHYIPIGKAKIKVNPLSFGDRLLWVTANCRDDMHEPDEAGISAIVCGTHLDNAMGDDPKSNCGELTIGLITKDGPTDWFNLADLIALAREGARKSKMLDKANDRITELEFLIEQASDKFDDMQRENDDQEEELQSCRDKADDLEEELDEANDRIETLEEDIKGLKSELDDAEMQIKQLQEEQE